ncbi:Hypothetical protein MELLADRAFT_32223 [Melampsora larici-populina 98AG31]|uniref:3'(2'),5'-bisphosphate nucleotidase n=1 Tax=Melampsora larici-populina (strain 98AG31 / pathotype 3-4-7) TaxID=747676 RepID=F4R422_MELLP|nr:Hypothetical protein MELLADRAFT_32223 [Melampsora larici-populina 98AG31]EGG13067.1 Hypothetical protein MELLADRAFT_32223 [Melampsora larici-populina 98AG31]
MLKLNEIKTNFQKERQIGISSILKSTILTQKVFKTLIQKDQIITKQDKSPVTIGDYGSQALINLLISKHFPNDKIIGEEEIQDLQTTSNSPTLNQIERLINETLTTKLESETDEEVWKNSRIPKSLNQSEILETINLGNSKEENEDEGNGERFWTLDPIDGTKGFLRSDQYSICLSLIINKKVTLSFISAPNLSTDPYPSSSNPSSKIGTLFYAEHGKGAYQRPINTNDSSIYSPIRTNPISFNGFQTSGTFCESWESNHSNQILNSKILAHLKLSNPTPIRLDSQVKYCLIARGDVNVYLRLPIDLNYKEKIWDHAAGSLLVEEAGGKVTDMWGKPLDFSLGKTLIQNEGIVASHPNLHQSLLDAIKSVSKL